MEGTRATGPPEPGEGTRYTFRLYVSGATPGSSRAVAAIKEFCERFLRGRYLLEVVDVYQQAGLAEQEQIVATPTLVKVWPLPSRRMVGGLDDPQRIQTRLGLPSRNAGRPFEGPSWPGQ